MFDQTNPHGSGWKKKWMTAVMVVTLGSSMAIGVANAATASPEASITPLDDSTALLKAGGLDPNSDVTVDTTAVGDAKDEASNSGDNTDEPATHHKHHHGKRSGGLHRQGRMTARADRRGRIAVRISLPKGFDGDISAVVAGMKHGSHHSSHCSKRMHGDGSGGRGSSSNDTTTTTMTSVDVPTTEDQNTTTTSVPASTSTTMPVTTTTMPATTTTTVPTTSQGSAAGLADPTKKDIAMQIVSSNENSSLDWKAQYGYIEYNVEGNSAENRGYTAGLIGFCTKCGDLSDLVDHYNELKPNNVLTKYTNALHSLAQSESSATTGLGSAFVADWKTAAKDTVFQQAQMDQLDKVYFNPAVSQAKQDGLGTLGQFIYYDALVMHGPGSDSLSFGGIRSAALAKAKTPAQGGNEKTYLNAFLDARKAAMLAEQGHQDTTRVDTEQRVWLQNGNLSLVTPLTWSVYGEQFSIK